MSEWKRRRSWWRKRKANREFGQGLVGPDPGLIAGSVNGKPVIVVGAGVAGLTAAHELAARGFKVHVIEADEDTRLALPEEDDEGDEGDEGDDAVEDGRANEPDRVGVTPALGGMARSQYLYATSEQWKTSDPVPGEARDLLVRGRRIEGRACVLLGTVKFSKKQMASLGDKLFKGVKGEMRHPTASGRAHFFKCLKDLNFEFEVDAADRMELILSQLFSTSKPSKLRDPAGATSPSLGHTVWVQPIGAGTVADAEDVQGTWNGPKSPKAPRKDRGVEVGRPPGSAAWPSTLGPHESKTAGPWDEPVEIAVWVEFWPSPGKGPKILEVPGEHGYRFFPSFYRHVFDTLGRIPVLPGPAKRYSRRGRVVRTVKDDLVSLDFAAFAMNDGRFPAFLRRAPIASLRELFRMQRLFSKRLGFSMADMLRFQLKVLQYMTSCTSRREDVYARQTWTDFVGVTKGFSKAFKQATEDWPQALVGLRGDEADARTFGNVLVQQVLDQVSKRSLRDATLNGATTDAWFDPWGELLESQLGVRFHRGTVTKLKWRNARGQAHPGEVRVVTKEGWHYEDEEGPNLDRAQAVFPDGAYLVLALPVQEAYRLFRTLDVPDAERAKADWDGASKRLIQPTYSVLDEGGETFRPAWTRQKKPRGALRHFSGIQYFLDEGDVPFLKGHLFLPKHPWGLSAVSQSQFRRVRIDTAQGVGAISFVIGGFDTKGGTRDLTVWESFRGTIGDSVWTGLLEAVRDTEVDPAEYPVRIHDLSPFFHIDDALIFRDFQFPDCPFPDWLRDPVGELDPSAYTERWHLEPDRDLLDRGKLTLQNLGNLKFNNTPYLVTQPGKFSGWPGILDPDAPTRGYDVELNNLVACGSYLKTFTRLVTMESSNESARHAVNGILRHHAAKSEAGVDRDNDDKRAKKPPKPPKPTPGSIGSQNNSVVDPQLSGGFCDVWPMEDRELEDLSFWKDVDARLHAEGLPHLLEILRIDDVVRELLPDPAADGPVDADERATQAVDGLFDLITGRNLDLASIGSWASPVLLQTMQAFVQAARVGR